MGRDSHHKDRAVKSVHSSQEEAPYFSGGTMTSPTLSEKMKEILYRFRHSSSECKEGFCLTEEQAHQAIMEAIRESVPAQSNARWGSENQEVYQAYLNGFNVCRKQILERLQ